MNTGRIVGRGLRVPLEYRNADLYQYLRMAESYADSDPQSAVTKMRLFVEVMVDILYKEKNLPRPTATSGDGAPSLFDLLENKPFKSLVPEMVLALLHEVRKCGNAGAHYQDSKPDVEVARSLLLKTVKLAEWFCDFDREMRGTPRHAGCNVSPEDRGRHRSVARDSVNSREPFPETQWIKYHFGQIRRKAIMAARKKSNESS